MTKRETRGRKPKAIHQIIVNGETVPAARCTVCLTVKALYEFPADRNTLYGHSSYCRKCKTNRSHKSRLAAIEREAAVIYTEISRIESLDSAAKVEALKMAAKFSAKKLSVRSLLRLRPDLRISEIAEVCGVTIAKVHATNADMNLIGGNVNENDKE